MNGQDILCGKVPFDIPHKTSCPYIETCELYSEAKIKELLDLRAHKCFYKAATPNR